MAYAIVLLLLLAALLAVPPVRAALVNIFRVGAITIFLDEPTPTSLPLETTVLDLAGRTSPEEAQAQVRFPLRLPSAYGRPDEVYLQRMPDPGLGGQVVIMVWLDPAPLRLYQIDVARYGFKRTSSEAVAQTEVGGQPAYWIEGEHQIQLHDGRGQEAFIVEHSVLVWSARDVTYRLEGERTLEEAVGIAETLVPMDTLTLPGPTTFPTPSPDSSP